MALTPEHLKAFLNEELGIDVSDVASESPLFSSGLIDSFSLVTLLSYVEETCGFRVGPMDVSLENFDSIDRIVAYSSNMTSSKA